MEFLKSNQTSSEHVQFGYDEGLRKFFLQVYNIMGVSLAITGLVAMFAASSSTIMSMMYNITSSGQVVGMSPLGWIVAFAPILLVIALSSGIARMSARGAQMIMWAYASLMGLSLSSIFLLYTGTSIARVFFITAGTFGAMSLYGYMTKSDLTKVGSFLRMGLIGIIIASIVNLFFKSPGLTFAVSILGVFIFVGLTAYDTQKIKNMYYNMPAEDETKSKVAILGALTLYLDFINLFIFMLRFFGNRRD